MLGAVSIRLSALLLAFVMPCGEEVRPEPAFVPDASLGPRGLVDWVPVRGGIQMARTETTNRQYKACVAARACRVPNNFVLGFGPDDHPMREVNWQDAVDFCRWVEGRLPTNTEWGNEATALGTRRYPWGDGGASCSRAVMDSWTGTDGCGRGTTWPVCSKPEGNSISGLCDMAGNVQEWVADVVANGHGLRGGALHSQAVLAATIESSTSNGTSNGFRCAR